MVDERHKAPDPRRAQDARLRQAREVELAAAVEAGQFRAALDGMSDGYLTVDREWRCTYLNAAAARFLGLSRAQTVGQSIRDSLARLGGTLPQPFDEQPLSGRGSQSFAWELELEGVWLEIRVFVNQEGLALFLHDVNERRRVETALRQAELRFRTLVEQVPVVTYTYDHRDAGRTLYISPQIQALTGYPPEAFTAAPEFWRGIIHPDDRERTQAEIDRTDASGEPYRIEHRYLRRDGQVVWVRNEAVLVRGDAGEPLFWQGVLQDITEQKRHEAELTQHAYHDALTGLPNRLLFEDRLRQELERAERYGRLTGVLYLDLDAFKAVNDHFGHPVGDQLLIAVARRLRDTLRSIDTVARIGGDEFVILLPALHEQADAVDVAERLLAGLRQLIEAAGHAFVLGGSIGIAISQPRDDVEQIIARADAALYQAKAAGKNRYVLAAVG